MSERAADLRVGIGWDRHRMEAGRRCVLAGVEIPHAAGPAGHSDGDVALHALADAILGAAGLADLGSLFPDDDPRLRGAASDAFLREALARAESAGFKPHNADLVIVADAPRIGPHRERMRARLAGLLGLPMDRVNVKGKTTELGLADRIEAYAIVLLAAAPT
jgi:2-C-methyl-D-erythritol 2,4-cyclodiphosphate synthase